MVHVERYQPDNVRNGRSRGPSPNGHNTPDTSDDDCKYISVNILRNAIGWRCIWIDAISHQSISNIFENQ